MNPKAAYTGLGFPSFEPGSDASITRGRRGLRSAAAVALASLLFAGLAPACGQFQYQRLKSFGFLEVSSGNYPSELIEASDGKLYGTTHGGGTNNAGTVFKLSRDGSGYTVLHTFSRTGSDGTNPGTGWDSSAGLVEGSDGMLYGTTLSGGGPNDAGTVFKLNKDGGGYTVLHRFTGPEGDGLEPSALMVGSDGALYGTTKAWGGINGAGAVFKLLSDGTGFQVLHRFAFVEGTGYAPLVEGSDGVAVHHRVTE